MPTKEELEQENAQLRAQLLALQAEQRGVAGDDWIDVWAGNPAPIRHNLEENAENGPRVGDVEVVAFFRIPEEYTDDERLMTITSASGIWSSLSVGPPSWVATEDDKLSRRLSAWFDCEVKSVEEVLHAD